MKLWLFAYIGIALANLTNQPGYVSAVYYSEWSYYLDHSPSDIPFAAVTNIYYAFLKIDEKTLTLHFDDNALATKSRIPFHTDAVSGCVSQNHFFSSISGDWLGQLLANVSRLAKTTESIGLLGQLSQIKTLNPNVKLSVSIGGARTAKAFEKMTKSPASMEKFVNSVVKAVHRFGLDGVDIDWEYPDSSHTQKLNALLRLLREKLDAAVPPGAPEGHSYLLTLTLPGDEELIQAYDLAELAHHVTYFNLMGYDLSGVWSGQASFQSLLFRDKDSPASNVSVDDTVQYLLQKRHVDSRQIVLGLPAYGRTFNAAHLYGEADACAHLNGIKQEKKECIVGYNKLPPEGYHETFDTKAVAAYATNNKDGVIVYDNAQSARLKAQYVKKHKLAGGLWWDSSGDVYRVPTNRSLLYNFVDELGGMDSLKKSCWLVNEHLYHGEFNTTGTNVKSGGVSAFKVSLVMFAVEMVLVGTILF